jgi:pimeloyl-ACP methyl ester carboxylesterase
MKNHSPRLRNLRKQLASSLVLLVLASGCSTPALPRVAVAQPALSSTGVAALRDEKLAGHLAAAEARGATHAGAATEAALLALQARVNLHDWKSPLRIQGGGRTWVLSFDNQPLQDQGKREWSPAVFDRLFAAASIKPEGYTHRYAGTGAGAPVVLAFEDVARLRKERGFRPGNGLFVAGTAVFEFGAATGDGTPVRLRVFNTAEERAFTVAGSGRLDLAWDLTAAVECNMDSPYLRHNGLAGLFHPEARANDIGLFGMSTYDRNKIPVVLVHGLNSDPHIWKNAVNEILGTPELNARFTPLLFMYPTGMPVPGAAARLRDGLQTYRQKWDPDHNDPGMNNMVLVGHSMGGLLARLQVIDSGDELWKAFFSRPIEDVPWVSIDDRKRMASSLQFNAQPFVKRVIFVAVPHRGSQVADFRFVQWAMTRLIHLPSELVDYTSRALTDTAMLNPALLKYNSLGLRSVDMLSPGHPYFAAIDRRPIRVPYHSIIGDRGRANGQAGSDGIVPFWSSYLPGAVSTRMVPFGHSCTAEPQTVDEITRILRSHAN